METEVRLGKDASLVRGPQDRFLRKITGACGVQVVARGDTVTFRGEKEAVEKAVSMLQQIADAVENFRDVNESLVDTIVESERVAGKTRDCALEVFRKGKVVLPRTAGQTAYIRAMNENSIVFCVGPAGTGKTYLAVAYAISSLKKKRFRRVILTRPAVEAGEKLGFLPGDIMEKVNPYLRPLYDAMGDMMEFEEVTRCVSKGIVEIVPLAFMRGRTLNDAFVILDEAQNCTSSQMKMFLTRLGDNAKAVITGDVTQIDIPDAESSGLIEARRILKGIEGIAFIDLSESDIVRHPLVQHIVKAYEAARNKPR